VGADDRSGSGVILCEYLGSKVHRLRSIGQRSGGLKMQDLKMTDQMSEHENEGPANEGPNELLIES